MADNRQSPRSYAKRVTVHQIASVRTVAQQQAEQLVRTAAGNQSPISQRAAAFENIWQRGRDLAIGVKNSSSTIRSAEQRAANESLVSSSGKSSPVSQHAENFEDMWEHGRNLAIGIKFDVFGFEKGIIEFGGDRGQTRELLLTNKSDLIIIVKANIIKRINDSIKFTVEHRTVILRGRESRVFRLKNESESMGGMSGKVAECVFAAMRITLAESKSGLTAKELFEEKLSENPAVLLPYLIYKKYQILFMGQGS